MGTESVWMFLKICLCVCLLLTSLSTVRCAGWTRAQHLPGVAPAWVSSSPVVVTAPRSLYASCERQSRALKTEIGARGFLPREHPASVSGNRAVLCPRDGWVSRGSPPRFPRPAATRLGRAEVLVWAAFVRGKKGKRFFSPEAEGSVIKEPKDHLLNIQLNFVVCLSGSVHGKEVCTFNESSDKQNERWWKETEKWKDREDASENIPWQKVLSQGRDTVNPAAPGKSWLRQTPAK